MPSPEIINLAIDIVRLIIVAAIGVIIGFSYLLLDLYFKKRK